MSSNDDLAARLDSDRLQEWFTELQASASLLPEDLQIIEAMIARASTHPEQSGRVENPILSETADHCEYGCEGACESLDHWKDRASYWYEVSESWREQVPGQAPSDLWPASPTPTEQEDD